MRPVEDLAALTLRELLTLARERLGPAASSLKTREELTAALTGGEVRTQAPQVQVVTRDFFKRHGS